MGEGTYELVEILLVNSHLMSNFPRQVFHGWYSLGG
jgi:hypothetical protein